MFCPKCGTKNPETGKFCRTCGTDLANISAALSGNLSARLAGSAAANIQHKAGRSSDPNELYGEAIKQILTGIGFLVVSIALLTTGVAGGHAWWWAMLFPAFGCLGKGVSDYLKSKKIEKQQLAFGAQAQASLNQPGANASLPSPQTQYVAPESPYKTGDIVPSSVTDGTTRHLEINPEGKTMTLPKTEK
ncbi:MAG: hypothetical protein JWN60_2447 [Acidobacteria bacterium]|nr:hypothetical protein [Acidobacteriota bacterium]